MGYTFQGHELTTKRQLTNLRAAAPMCLVDTTGGQAEPLAATTMSQPLMAVRGRAPSTVGYALAAGDYTRPHVASADHSHSVWLGRDHVNAHNASMYYKMYGGH